MLPELSSMIRILAGTLAAPPTPGGGDLAAANDTPAAKMIRVNSILLPIFIGYLLMHPT
jgi:hypothetical protein